MNNYALVIVIVLFLLIFAFAVYKNQTPSSNATSFCLPGYARRFNGTNNLYTCVDSSIPPPFSCPSSQYIGSDGASCVTICPPGQYITKNTDGNQACAACTSPNVVSFDQKTCNTACPSGETLLPTGNNCVPNYTSTRHSTNFVSYNYTDTGYTDISTCESRCNSNPNCSGYTSHYPDNDCVLQIYGADNNIDTIVKTDNDKNYVTFVNKHLIDLTNYVIPQYPCGIYTNTNPGTCTPSPGYPLTQISQTTQSDSAACGKSCLASPSCKLAVYTKNNKQCTLLTQPFNDGTTNYSAKMAIGKGDSLS